METDGRVDYSKDVKEIETYSAKCQNCGSAMVFDPETQSLKCEHCGSTLPIEKDFNVVENDVVEGFEQAEKWDSSEQATYKCDNCGAVVVLSVDEEASNCPFCGATHIAKEGSFSSIRPHVVIPFQITAENAKEKSKKWAKKRIL